MKGRDADARGILAKSGAKEDGGWIYETQILNAGGQMQVLNHDANHSVEISSSNHSVEISKSFLL